MSLLALLLAPAAFAAGALSAGHGVTLYFQDGGSVSGILASVDDQGVTLEVPGGEMGWDFDDIKSIEPADTSYEKFLRDVNAANGDTDKLTKLAAQAKSRGWVTDYNELADELDLPVSQPPQPSGAGTGAESPEPQQAAPPQAPSMEEQASGVPQPPAAPAPSMGYGAPGALPPVEEGLPLVTFGQFDPIPPTERKRDQDQNQQREAHHDEKGDAGNGNKVDSGRDHEGR